MATVTGVGQVVVIENDKGIKKIHKGLLGAEGLEISVYLPGDKFRIE
jgi:hypothetical protein